MPLCSVPVCNISGVHLFPKDAVLKKSGRKLYGERILWLMKVLGYVRTTSRIAIMLENPPTQGERERLTCFFHTQFNYFMKTLGLVSGSS